MAGGRLRPPAFGAPPFGGGVIGNTAGSGPVIGGSSPPPRALAPSSSGLGRRPLKAVTAVRIRSGLLETQVERPGSHRVGNGRPGRLNQRSESRRRAPRACTAD